MVEQVNPYRKTGEEVDLIFRSFGEPQINLFTKDKLWTTNFIEPSPFPFDDSKTPYQLALSPLGEKTIGKYLLAFLKRIESGKLEPTIRSLDEITGLRGIVKLTTINGGLLGIGGTRVYVKTLKPIAGIDIDVTGIEQFAAMRLLEVNGVQVASPLLATHYRLVTRAIAGLPADENATFISYLRDLNRLREKLISRDLWNEEWRIDEQPRNYLHTLSGIVAVDPIFRSSIFISG